MVKAGWKIEACLGLCINKKAVKRLKWLKIPLLLATDVYYLKIWVTVEKVYPFAFRHLKEDILSAVAFPWGWN